MVRQVPLMSKEKKYEFQHIERGIQQLLERQTEDFVFVVMSEVFDREKKNDILITKLLSDRRGLLCLNLWLATCINYNLIQGTKSTQI